MSNLDKQTGRMRPYHILLAVRIIILYQLILLFCVHRGLHFFLVLLFAISETSPTYSTRFVLLPPSPFLSCWWCSEFVRLSVYQFLIPPPPIHRFGIVSLPFGSWVFPRTGGAFLQYFSPPCTL
jgi:hypothetical protein